MKWLVAIWILCGFALGIVVARACNDITASRMAVMDYCAAHPYSCCH